MRCGKLAFMNDKDLNKISDLCKSLALKGGKEAKKAFEAGAFEVSSKKDNTFLTTADTYIESFIREIIKESFPNHSIVGEGYGTTDKNSDYRWYIDPIDGTTNFVLGIPFFCTMIGVVYKDEVAASAIYEPMTDRLFWAQKEKGAYLNKRRLKVKKGGNLSKTVLAADRVHADYGKNDKLFYTYLNKNFDMFRSVKKMQCIGASVPKIATGEIGAYLAIGESLYDYVPPSLIAKEAGASVLNRYGREWSPNDGEWLICTSPDFKNKLMESIKKL